MGPSEKFQGPPWSEKSPRSSAGETGFNHITRAAIDFPQLCFKPCFWASKRDARDIINDIIIRLSSLSGLYANWHTLIGCLAVQYVFRQDRLVLVGKFPSRFEDKQTRFKYVLQKIYHELLRKKKLNLLKDNLKLKTRWTHAKNHEVIGENKQVN